MNQSTRNMTNMTEYFDKKFDELKKELKTEFKSELLTEFKKILDDQRSMLDDLIKSNIKHESTISSLQTQIENLSAYNVSMQSQISELKNKIGSTESNLDLKIDLLEQYGRRQSVRIEGVAIDEMKDKADPVIEIIQSCFNEMGLKFPSSVIDRAHRIGPIYKNYENIKCQTVLLKFTSFNSRTQFYKKRKALSNKRVRLDLTKRNYNILKDSISLINQEENPTTYIFADINCRLKVVDTNNGNESFVNSFEEVRNFLGQH